MFIKKEYIGRYFAFMRPWCATMFRIFNFGFRMIGHGGTVLYRPTHSSCKGMPLFYIWPCICSGTTPFGAMWTK